MIIRPGNLEVQLSSFYCSEPLVQLYYVNVALLPLRYVTEIPLVILVPIQCSSPPPQGICPEVRGQVWKFLLAYYPFLSTREEREQIDTDKR